MNQHHNTQGINSNVIGDKAMSEVDLINPRMEIETSSYFYDDLCLDENTHTNITITAKHPDSGDVLYSASAVRYHCSVMFSLNAFSDSLDENDDSATIFESIFENHPCCPDWFKPQYRQFNQWHELIQRRVLERFGITLPNRDIDFMHLYEFDVSDEGKVYGYDEANASNSLIAVINSDMPPATKDALIFILLTKEEDYSFGLNADVKSLFSQGWVPTLSTKSESRAMKYLGGRTGNVLAKYFS
tara:strand:- start:91988 stop:92719 length:732 start_codon:yes stop_codon:yes gene_type:complete